MATSRLTETFYLWRPSLSDKGDGHLLELAIAARAAAIVTHSRSDFMRSELKCSDIRILALAELLKEYP